ncbi:MAG: hypothetical protein PHJ00_02990 [Candidatus Omnitrophica bacterium]|nr:hypothetical protein [Candidatus Omnitrophota bacterium]MDD5654241.1 hypothetical protein [Candidatus Omnitrophota bacterium]
MSIFKRNEYLRASLIFLACALIFTWPLVLHLKTAVPVGAAEPEAVVMSQLFAAHWTGAALQQGISYWDPSFFYPYKGAFSWCEPQLAFSFLVWLLSNLTGYVCAYNLAILLCLVISGLAGYAMSRLLTDDRIASLWCGIWLTGGAYSLQQLSEPAILAAGLPCAFILFCLLYVRDKKPLFFWITVFIYILSWFTSKQLTFYATLLLPFILSAHLYRHKWKASDLARLFLGTALTLAFILPYFLSQLSYTKAMGFGWMPQDIARFSIRLEHLFLPAYGNWLILRILDHKWYSFDIGVVPLSVIALSFILGIYKAGMKDLFKKRLIRGLFIMAVLALLMGFGPSLKMEIDGKYNGPYFFLLSIIPALEFIRIPSRILVFVIFGVTVFSAFSFAYVRSCIKTAAIRRLLTGLLFVFLFAEMWAVPVALFYPDNEIDRHKTVINWLAGRGDNGALLEFPLPPTYRSVDMKIGAGAQLRMLKHHKPVLNGYATFEPVSHKQLRDAFKNGPVGRGKRYLEAYGARYVLVHQPALICARIEDLGRLFGGELVYQDAGHAVYSLPGREPLEEAAFLPVSADCGEKAPQKRRVYGIPLLKPVSRAVLIKPRPNWYIEFKWMDSKGSVRSKEVLVRGGVIMDAGQKRLYLRVLKFPKGGARGEAVLVSAE